jgi:hypothetical protein
MEDVMLLHIRQLCSILGGGGKGKDVEGREEGKDGKWNMSDWFSYLSYDVMGELCFGKSYDMLINSARRGVISLVDRAAFRHYVVSSLTLSLLLSKKESELINSSAVSGSPSKPGILINSSSAASPTTDGPS